MTVEPHRQVFESMTEAFARHELLLDADGTPRDCRFLEVNPSFERMTGLEKGEVVGRCMTEVLPGVEPGWFETYGEVVRTGRSVRLERHEERLGRWYDVLAFRTGPREFGVLFLDITERKRNEEVIAFLAQPVRSGGGERFFQDLAEFLARSLQAHFVCIDRLEGDGLTAQTLAVWCDGAFQDNVSYALKDTPCGDVVGKDVCCFPASVCQFFPRDQVLQDLSAESYVGITLWRHDGSPIGLIAVIWRSPMTDTRMATTVLKRIGPRAASELERLEAERSLRASEDFFRRMVRSLPIPTMLVDERQAIALLNDEFTRVLGYAAADLPDVGSWYRKAFPQEPYRCWAEETWCRAVGEAAAVGATVPPTEFRVTCKEGTVRSMLLSALPVAGSLLVCLVDMSRERALQAQLAMSSRLAAMGTLVAGIAHEVNNPLSAELSGQGLALEIVRSARQRLAGAAPGPGDVLRDLDDATEALEDAQEGGRRVARIIRDLAAFASPDTRRTPIQLADVARSALRWVPPESTQLSTIAVEDRGAPKVLASFGQIEQLIVNLVTNASKAMPPGTPGTIVIRLTPGSPGMARLEVVDDGVGIAPELRDRIFEPFFTTRPSGEGRGTGMGLAICHAIVTAHGGTLAVETELGKGSTFRVELPAAPAVA